MATQNLFELLGDEETDASAVIERAEAMEKVKKKQQQQEKTQAPRHQDPPKLPSKPLPPAQAVAELKAGQQESGKGKGQGRVYGNRDREYSNNYRNRDRDLNGAPNSPSQEGGLPRNRSFDRSEEVDGFQTNRSRSYGQGRPAPNPSGDVVTGNNFEGGRAGGRFRSGPTRRPSRPFGENAGGFGEGQQQRAYVKKDAAGGLQEAQDKPEAGDAKEAELEKESVADKPPVEESKAEVGAVEEKKVQEEEDNEMLLDDYYKALDEKTKHLKSQRTEVRKVVVDKEFSNMTMVERKEEGDFVKLGSEKDKGKKKEAVTKDEKAKKNVSINEFLRPAEGDQHFGFRRDRGRGGGGRGRAPNERGEGNKSGRAPNERGEGNKSGFNFIRLRQDMAPRIEDPSQFPTLGAA